MPKKILLLAASALLALPALAQTTTTVTTDQQQPPPPPRTRVRVSEEATPAVETVPNGRSSVAIVATDALYGGIAGALIGGGVTLIDEGNHWQRDLMVGAGIGVLAGAAFGVYEAAMQPSRVVARAAADRNAAASDGGTMLAAAGARW